MSLLPSRPDVTTEPGPRVVGVDSDEADAMLSALSSGTARELLAELHEEPSPPAELADRVDTTLQNAQYHLGKLEDAGAIEVVGTAYSAKGREMDVYAPADEPLVIFAGSDEGERGLRTALTRLLGGVAALAVGAVAIQEVLGGGVERLVPWVGDQAGAGRGPSAGGPVTPTPTAADGGTATPLQGATPTAPPSMTETPAPTPTEVSSATDTAARVVAEGAGGGLPPGLVFFLGGLTVLLVGAAWSYARG